MTTGDVLAVASRQASWLSARQMLIATNVAHVNTPGFRPLDMRPFGDFLEGRIGMAATAPKHLSEDAGGASLAGARARTGGETFVSGNSVSIEKEMIAAGEVNQSLALNMSAQKAFHRMLMLASKA